MLESGPIVVPLDGSKGAERAVPVALQIARAYGDEITFVHVIEEGGEARLSGNADPDSLFRDYVANLLPRETAAEVTYSTVVRKGSPAAEILGLAGQGARLVVIATHGRGGLKAALIGSVTDKVVRANEVSVLTVPVEGESNLVSGPMLVALDGSETAEQALPIARDLADRLRVPVTLLRAYWLQPTSGSMFIMYEYDAVDTLKDAAEEYVRSVAREGEEGLTAMAPAAAAIEDAANQKNAGLVVMTSHGRGMAYRITLGSTTDRVLHSLKRPLLIVPSN